MGLHRVFLKTIYGLLKLFGRSFHVTVSPVNEGRNVTYSLTGQETSPRLKIFELMSGRGWLPPLPTSDSGTCSLNKAFGAS